MLDDYLRTMDEDTGSQLDVKMVGCEKEDDDVCLVVNMFDCNELQSNFEDLVFLYSHGKFPTDLKEILNTME